MYRLDVPVVSGYLGRLQEVVSTDPAIRQIYYQSPRIAILSTRSSMKRSPHQSPVTILPIILFVRGVHLKSFPLSRIQRFVWKAKIC
jgi:hypothetical protein